MRLVRKHPVTGQTERQCYYVIHDGALIGRVRMNDGWNAATWDADSQSFDSVAGWWRSRRAAVDGLVSEHLDLLG